MNQQHLIKSMIKNATLYHEVPISMERFAGNFILYLSKYSRLNIAPTPPLPTLK